MKLVQCKIVLHNAQDYKLVIDALLHVFLDHVATYSAPITFTVTVNCNHIQAERNLDEIMSKLNMQCEKRPLDIPESRPQAPDYERLRAQAVIPLYTRPVAA